MTDKKPTLATTPTQMAFRIQDIEIKLNNLEEKLQKLERKGSNGKKTKKND
tara:strand:- start:2129 stop:2281 length:153 start_codon:yes stop_codon:yes gene_type:complete